MDVFTIKANENKTFKLTRENFERITEKSRTYYRDDGNHYAICPACHNPIQIINLINSNIYEKGKRKPPKTHGRHLKSDLDGLVKYDAEKYHKCPFANPKCFGTETRRRNKDANNEIINLVNNQGDILLKYIRNISGINFSKSRFENEFVKYFMAEEGYDYEYINRFNLPYSFLYLQREISIFGSYLSNRSTGSEIASAIERKSKHLKVVDNKIVRKDNSYVNIKLLLLNHKIDKQNNQTVELHVIEGKDTIYKKNININMSDFLLEVYK